jgi:hypothetical protein
MKLRFSVALSCAVLVLGFQNCSNVKFGAIEAPLTESSLSAVETPLTNEVTTDTFVETKMNVPVEFEVTHSNSMIGLQISIEALSSTAPLNGTFEIINLDTFKLKYTPNWGFRGKDRAIATVKNKLGQKLTFNITVTVGNSLQFLEPALAIRGMGCIQCHAKVNSNIVTDFGYKNDFYFGSRPATSWWNSGGIYGDHANNFNTIVLPSDKTVIVPKANLPLNLVSESLQTLADYIKSQLSKSANQSTQAAQVIEKNNVYIGAPTDSDIKTAFKLADSERLKYFKNSSSALTFSGLNDEGDFFRNTAVLNCEGDLAIRGPLLLENLQVNSKTGCRLYVIGSVFIYGEITYMNNDLDRNLQITSTKSISLGLGSVMNNGSYCNANDQYTKNAGGYGTNSLITRYVTFWTVPGNYVRQSSDPKAFGQTIVDEARLIEANTGVLYDAVCRPEGRSVSFERIIFNAPIVQSRYQGDISGTVIAEFAIMSLDQFKFSFDQVFARVPVFPFLEMSTYLEVKD